MHSFRCIFLQDGDANDHGVAADRQGSARSRVGAHRSVSLVADQSTKPHQQKSAPAPRSRKREIPPLTIRHLDKLAHFPILSAHSRMMFFAGRAKVCLFATANFVAEIHVMNSYWHLQEPGPFLVWLAEKCAQRRLHRTLASGQPARAAQRGRGRSSRRCS